MSSKAVRWATAGLMAVVLLGAARGAIAQSTGSQSTPDSPGATGSIAAGKDNSPLNAANALRNVSPREEGLYQTFKDTPDTQLDKKVKLGKDFLKDFSNSIYVPSVHAILTVSYFTNNQPENGVTEGEKALALNPDDTRTLANLAQALARTESADIPNRLEKAQAYATKCIEVTPKLRLPEGKSLDEFKTMNNRNLAMAHSALGTVSIRRGKFADAIPELKEAVRLDTEKDTTNLYLLGLANQNSGHYADALDAFKKCVAVPGNLQKACSDGAAEAQKRLGAAH